LPKFFASIFSKFNQIAQFNQIYPTKSLLRDAAASPAPTALSVACLYTSKQ